MKDFPFYWRNRVYEDFLNVAEKEGVECENKKGFSREFATLLARRLESFGYGFQEKEGRFFLRNCPEKPYPWEVGRFLKTHEFHPCIGREIIYFEEIDSTNTFLMDYGEVFLSGLCVIANAQTAGRGRAGRKWHSPPGLNIYTSILLKIESEDAGLFNSLTLTTGIAVHRVLEKLGLFAELKWPNDIIISHKKIAGILLEGKNVDDKEKIAVIGIGLNVNAEEHHFPPDLRANATSVKLEKGFSHSRAKILTALYEELNYCYHKHLERGFSYFKEEYEGRLGIMGKKVRILKSEGFDEGSVLGVGEDGSLLLKNEGGILKIYSAGDIIVLK